MPLLGNPLATAFSTINKQTITGNGTVGPYTLDYSAGSDQDIEVFVNNVRQEPGVAYTVAGTSLTMTGTVASSDGFYVLFQGKAQQTVKPADDSISTAMLKADSVSTAKIADNAITMAKLATSGTLPALDGSALTGISSGLSNVVDDTTPQLGGNLDLNSNNITGTGYIDISGKVATDTIEHSTAGSVATNYLVLGSAKAWVYYDNLGSNVTRGSFSISSVTDNGTGDATVTISNAMTDAFSCIAGLTGYSTSDPSTRFMSGCIPSTTTVRLESIKTNSDNTDQNCNHMCIIGDLA